jgi:arylsulfatase A-like enzyme
MDGKSFKKALYDGRFNTGTKFSMYLYQMNPVPNFQTTSIAALHGDYKLIKYLKFNQYEMYNLKKDPNEKNNLVRLEPERFSTLKQEIDEFLAPKRPQ